MYIREVHSARRHSSRTKVPSSYRFRPLVSAVLLLAVMIGWMFLGTSQASTLGGPIKSGWSGYCLDDHDSKEVVGNPVDLWSCNNTAAQDWQVSLTTIKHDSLCLTAQKSSSLILDSCNDGSNQVWLRDASGLLNPASSLCLTAINSTQNLSLESCRSLSLNSQKWMPDVNYANYPCVGSQGQRVACYAVKQWISWTNSPKSHEALLTKYTGGAPQEEWCADFVSYIYKEAGYPFSNGNFDGWDENIAGNIASQGFTPYQPAGYTPKPGDVAYFDYPGGHVEIVISGGSQPTFIYGDSGTIDPTTGNGDMAANTITFKSGIGSLQYYLAPNTST